MHPQRRPPTKVTKALKRIAERSGQPQERVIAVLLRADEVAKRADMTFEAFLDLCERAKAGDAVSRRELERLWMMDSEDDGC
jgi:CRP-like cAMP-binding protein